MKNIGNIFFAIFIIIFFIFGYFWYQKIAGSSEEVLVVAEKRVVSQEFLAAINKLRTIKINKAFFENESFRALQDFTPLIKIPANIGRANPFLPLQFL